MASQFNDLPFSDYCLNAIISYIAPAGTEIIRTTKFRTDDKIKGFYKQETDQYERGIHISRGTRSNIIIIKKL